MYTGDLAVPTTVYSLYLNIFMAFSDVSSAITSFVPGSTEGSIYASATTSSSRKGRRPDSILILLTFSVIEMNLTVSALRLSPR